MMNGMTEIRQTALTPREAAEVLSMSVRQVQRLAGPGGPLVVERRVPVILITPESVDALKAKREAAA